MTGPKVRLGGMDRNKKPKAVTHLWRPVSTKACSIEDVIIESEDGGQFQETHCGASSSISSTQEARKVVEAVSEVTQSTIASSTPDYDIEERALEGESEPTEKHSLSIEVGASLFWFIKGKGGSTQQKIEEDMGIKIITPQSKKEESIVIEGSSVGNVTKASEKIQAIIDEAVKSRSLDYSHFISLPLAIHPQLVDKLVSFQNSILGNIDASVDENMESDSNEDTSDNEEKDQDLTKGQDVAVEHKVEDDKHVKVDLTSIPFVSYAPKASKSPPLSDLGIDKSIFIKPKTFHLTVLMLKLWNEERVNAASEVLKDCMRGSRAKAHVLYVTVEEIGSEDRLLRACQVITDAFVEAGLVLEKDAKQKLKSLASIRLYFDDSVHHISPLSNEVLEAEKKKRFL